MDVSDMAEELADYARLTERLSALLTGVANGLKGEPPALVWHDWSDLPRLALQMAGQLAEIRALIQLSRQISGGERMTLYVADLERILEQTSADAPRPHKKGQRD